MESEITVNRLQKNIEDLNSEQSASKEEINSLKEEVNSLKNEQLALKSTLSLVQEKYLKTSNINQDSPKSK